MLAAIDIGGTYIKHALFTMEKGIFEYGKVSTQASRGGEHICNTVCKIIDKYVEADKIEGIAISTAGQINAITGQIVYATENIPSYTQFPMKEILEKRYKVRVCLENDVNAAALGELWKGNIKEKNFIALTIGTGIGGAIVLDGHIFRGNCGLAGELGHMTIDKNGDLCSCGSRGCFENYASMEALKKEIFKTIGNIDTENFFQKVKDKEALAQTIYNRWIDNLAEGIKNIVHMFNPSLILLGGGVSAQGDFLVSSIETSLKDKIMPSFQKKLKIACMKLGNDANLYGAVYWYFQSEGKQL